MFSSSFSRGYGSYDYFDYDGFGPDRSGWAEKSEAAIRRERTANSKFDEYLKKCTSLST
jgi:hypothetical protein